MTSKHYIESLTSLAYFALSCEAIFSIVPKGHEIVMFVCVQNVFEGKHLCICLSHETYDSLLVMKKICRHLTIYIYIFRVLAGCQHTNP